MKDLPSLISHYKESAVLVLATAPSRYLFLVDHALQQLIKKGQLAGANFHYTYELMAHIHMVALISIRRNLKWIEGIELSMAASNYFLFCASLRGLIEAAADSYFSLRPALGTLTANFSLIKCCLEKRFDKALFVDGPTEDLVVHFIQAGKYEDKSKSPEHFKANKTMDYIARIDEDDPQRAIYGLYQQLCQISHPARDSVWIFLDKRPDGTWGVKGMEDSQKINAALADAHLPAFERLFQKSLNVSLLSLFFLDKIDSERFPCPGARTTDFSKVDGFSEMKKEAGL